MRSSLEDAKYESAFKTLAASGKSPIILGIVVILKIYIWF